MATRAFILAGILATGSVMAADEKVENPVTQDGVVKITWQNPDKYSDIESTAERQSRFEQRAFDSMTENLAKLARKVLTHGEQMQMTVTNVDLAGDVRPTFGASASDIRVLKDIYPPKITFSYQITKGQQVIMSGEEELRDLNYLGGIQPRRQESFMYENQMLKHWFNKTITPRMEGTPPK
ncbi:DUF3016 domain-containing protein [Shewanella submarina]|uniref:DUF3016 domain-containing protein n=1 Tax=Shewanella submarina TaxID=2016376 RepID=A0ABV7G8D9_9GAMM|nr:DUF3016 domain-containing protein [Shewanella submarina]MCL1038445.1 DUF3016 domain-containing protein [Shewanella submarina]